MHADVRRHRSPVSFVALTFALSVPFWVLGAVAKTPEGTPVPLPLSALQLVTPLTAASILVHRDEGGRSCGASCGASPTRGGRPRGRSTR
jgi:hypothetical protein